MDEYEIRHLEINDFNKRYLELLSQLSDVNKKISFETWKSYITNIFENRNHNIFVIEKDNIIIASITLLIEKKCIRNFKNVAHIEDLIIHTKYRNKKMASKLIEHCISNSKNIFDCYKIILNCKKELESFYNKFDFENKNIEMSLYF